MIYKVEGKRPFDFDRPEFLGSQSEERKAFYRENHDKPITEEQFVAEVASWTKKPLYNSTSRGASQSRHDYRRLVKLYGFFPGGQING